MSSSLFEFSVMCSPTVPVPDGDWWCERSRDLILSPLDQDHDRSGELLVYEV